MIELRRNANLLQKPLGTNGLGYFRTKYFYGNAARVAEVGAEEDRAHAAFADLTIDGVAADECGGQALYEVQFR